MTTPLDQLTDAQADLVARARTIAQNELRPRAAEWDRRAEFPEEQFDLLRRAGLTGLTVPVARTTPDGERLTWQLTVHPDGFGDGVIPFLIDWGDADHPSRAAPPGQDHCALQRFDAFHPRANAIADAIDALGVHLDVQPGATPHLRATLTGPAGTLELR